MTLPDFLTYAIALAIAAAIPGPGVIAIVARALGAGLRPTLPMLFGLVLGDVVYLAAAILGLAYVASTFGTLFVVINIVVDVLQALMQEVEHEEALLRDYVMCVGYR